MTTQTTTTSMATTPGNAFTDAMLMTWRNLKQIPRVPDKLMYGTIQPIMFVVLFAYVFGGAIPVSGQSSPDTYREFLMAGIFAQTMAFSVASSSVGLADDMHKGLIDRFRSFPIARSAVIAGRVVGDLVFNTFVMFVMVICGFVVGWSWHEGILRAMAAAFGLLLFLAFAMLWVGALIGLSVKSAEVAASAGLIWLFPVTFISNIFVPGNRLPDVLKAIAAWNPLSTVTSACRDLFGNPNPVVTDSFPTRHPLGLSLVYCVAITAIFAPLAIRKYNRATTT